MLVLPQSRCSWMSVWEQWLALRSCEAAMWSPACRQDARRRSAGHILTRGQLPWTSCLPSAVTVLSCLLLAMEPAMWDYER
jgi:hypothetical protein